MLKLPRIYNLLAKGNKINESNFNDNNSINQDINSIKELSHLMFRKLSKSIFKIQ